MRSLGHMFQKTCSFTAHIKAAQCHSKLNTVYRVNFVHIQLCARQAASFDVQFNYCVLILNDKLSCQRAV